MYLYNIQSAALFIHSFIKLVFLVEFLQFIFFFFFFSKGKKKKKNELMQKFSQKGQAYSYNHGGMIPS